MDTIQRVRSGRGTLLPAGLLVAAAGCAETLAQLTRWAPCIGDYSASDCGRLQDHRFDYFLPTPPWIPADAGPQYLPAAAWVPIPGAATLTGVAFVLLATAMLLTAWMPADRRSRFTPVAVAAWLVLSGLVLVVGVVNIVSGSTGVALGITGTVAVVWALLGPLLGVGLAVWLVTRWYADIVFWIVAAIVVVVGFRGSIAEYFLASAFYGSHDSPPFDGMPAAVAFVLLGGTLAAHAVRRPRTG